MSFKWFKKNKEKVEKVNNINIDLKPDLDNISTSRKKILNKNENEYEHSESINCIKNKQFLITNKSGLFSKLKLGLFKTHKVLSENIEALFKNKKFIDDDILDGLEELLITSDIGISTSMDLIEKISNKKSSIFSSENLKNVLKKEMIKYFDNDTNNSIKFNKSRSVPVVVMVVGVNGVGKTTTVGKLAAMESSKGNKVLIAAADTFRAGAIEQISICAEKAGVDIVKHKPNSDPASVAYDGVSAAISRGIDKVFIDTAGRLHTKINLMKELKKIKKSINKRLPGSPHEIFLILDATTGQNAISQVKKFDEYLKISGIIITKLDGTAKGGVTLNICRKFKIPIRYIGVGETMDDIQKFNSKKFINAIF